VDAGRMYRKYSVKTFLYYKLLWLRYSGLEVLLQFAEIQFAVLIQ
jgi:hypothetical protein